MSFIDSVNLGTARPIAAKSGMSGIDKRPVDGPVLVRAPGPKGAGSSGLAGDRICDTDNHGGGDQAVYAYSREDLDAWQHELGRPLPSGIFGENLTTRGLDVTTAVIGERWRIGKEVVLQVTAPRIPCRTFAVWLGLHGWVRTFTLRAVPGAYLRVIRPGHVRRGDPVSIRHRPDHDVTIGMTFRALTTQPELLPLLLQADDLPEEIRERARRRMPFDIPDIPPTDLTHASL
ncbi:MOSC domain-containing protein [Protofrankia symbiont of Coriaria ruscifolia]|uniref:MOSC domain-containing protein n=1 Tax=Protofrankia symbiont of Coriaria ruscifolia TaxID=1306542 RepID=UPI001041388B|nr:MOSC domain-containing protein [Protofrankia symbiont of Coriaria ruscifolia]